MAEIPFGASTWSVRSTLPSLALNGVYSGIVTGPVHGVYDRLSGVMQAFGRQAHHFQGFANMSASSVDHGTTWTVTFNDAADPGFNKFLITGWSLPHPVVANKRLHYRVQVSLEKAFLVADGTMQPGGIDLYASENGVAWTFLQNLHSWPAINQIGGNGGAVQINTSPSVTPPIFLAGSGPEGEGAYWMATAFSHDAGGAGNRTTFKACKLWRSLDGLEWVDVRDLEPIMGIPALAEIIQSTTGRLIILHGGAGSILFTDGSLLTGSFTGASFNGSSGIRGGLFPMYGGTWYTFSQGTLTGPGAGWISCDDCATFNGTGTNVVPQNQSGFGAKLGPSELMVIAPGFNDPSTETVSAYSNDGGETFLFSEPWIVSATGEVPCMLALRTGSRPIVMTRGGRIFVSSDAPRGTFQTRTICPLANAGLAAARPLLICGAPIAVNECSEG